MISTVQEYFSRPNVAFLTTIGSVVPTALNAYFGPLSWAAIGAAAIGGQFLSHGAGWAAEQCLGCLRTHRSTQRIQENYDSRDPSLDLGNLGLTSLSSQIGNLQHLQRLKLDLNQLASLPPEIGNLQSLQVLDLSFNQLTSLPLEIGNLQNLQVLRLYNNQLTSLEIGNLQSLQLLDLSFNQLTSLEIDNLQNLQVLDLSFNQLISLPLEIGNLQNLKKLGLSSNYQLSSLPPTIGNLQKLQRLRLSHTQLTGVPLELFQLPATCEVSLEDCPLTQTVLQRIQNVTTAPGYQGPRISHSIQEAHLDILDLPIETLLAILYKGLEQPPFPRLLQDANEKQRGHLRLWLAKISYIADSRKGGQTKLDLDSKIRFFLELAEKNAEFREPFFPIIEEASAKCGDRGAYYVIHLGMQQKLITIPLDQPRELSDFLIHGVWVIDQLEKIARDKVAILPFFDEVETYLAYPIELRERLRIPLDVKEMLYLPCSNVSNEELRVAGDQVSAQIESLDARSQFLAGQPRWRAAVQHNHPEVYEKIKDPEHFEAFVEFTKRLLQSFLAPDEVYIS